MYFMIKDENTFDKYMKNSVVKLHLVEKILKLKEDSA